MHKETIWFVEDHPLQRRSIANHLKRMGYEVVEFKDATEFESFIGKMDTDTFVTQYCACFCIIMDINLPPTGERKGIELVRDLRRKAKKIRDTLNIEMQYPDVVFQTGYNLLPKDDDFENNYRQVATLTKPFAFSKLDALLEKIRREKDER